MPTDDNIPGDIPAAAASADALLRLSDDLLSEINRTGKLPEGYRCIGELVASGTNRALAVELYLKALRLSCGLSPTTSHDLAGLFKGLPAQIKTLCSAKYEAIPQAPPETIKGYSVYASSDPNKIGSMRAQRPLPVMDNSLRAILVRSKDAFLHWRYLHERGGKGELVRTVYEFHYLGNAAIAIRGVLLDRDQAGEHATSRLNTKGRRS